MRVPIKILEKRICEDRELIKLLEEKDKLTELSIQQKKRLVDLLQSDIQRSNTFLKNTNQNF